MLFSVRSFHDFLLRAVFWTAVVMVFVPGAPHGTAQTTGLLTLENVRTEVLLTFARIRTELHARDLQAR